jgi:hypothetical protein
VFNQRGVAQLVEYAPGGRVVAGSSPVTPTLDVVEFGKLPYRNGA